MNYLIWYMAIGVVVITIVYIANSISKKDKSKSLIEPLHTDIQERKTLKHFVLNKFVGLLLAMVLAVTIWPVVLFMWTEELLTKKPNVAMQEREFAVPRSHLQERHSIADIEARECVMDPLNSVSTLPFGHLHLAWKTFIGNVEPEDDIWSFSAPWTTRGRNELRAGYVIVSGDVIGPHFLTAMKDLQDHHPNQAQH